jgi:uncharacterized membrane protein YgcG
MANETRTPESEPAPLFTDEVIERLPDLNHLLSPEEREELNRELARLAQIRRRAAAESAGLVMA